MLENVGIKFNIGKKCWKMRVWKPIYKITTKYYIKNLRKPYIKSYISK